MATFTHLPSGNWRVQIRRKANYISTTFRRFRDAEEWALAAERRIDLAEAPNKRGAVDRTTLAQLIDRAREGAGPATIGMDIGYLRLVVSHGAAVMASQSMSNRSIWHASR